MSSVSEIMSLVASLSIDDKLQLNHELSASMLTPKKAGKAKASKPSSRKGKGAAPGTMAWTAFVAHVQKTMPERFASPNLPKDRLIIAGAIRLEDPTAYEAFRTQFIADMPEPVAASDEESATEVAATATEAVVSEKPKRVISDEQKAAMKAGREKTAAAKKAAKEAGLPPPVKEKKVKEKVAKPAKEKAVKVTPAAAVGGGGSIPVAVAVAAVQDTHMQSLEIDGASYMLDPSNNNLFFKESDGGLGSYAGRYQPGQSDEIDWDADEA